MKNRIIGVFFALSFFCLTNTIYASDNQLLVSQYLANKDQNYLTIYVPKDELEYDRLEDLDVYIKGVRAQTTGNIVDERAAYFGYEIKYDGCEWPSMNHLPENNDYYGYKVSDISVVVNYSDGYSFLAGFELADHYFDQSFAISKDESSWCTTDYTSNAPIYDIVGHTFESYIQSLYDDNVVSGFSDKSFRPDYPVTRGAMAKFVRKGLGFGTKTDCEGFPDVETSNTFYDDIMTLKCYEVISGYSDGSFKPNELVTRGQAMKFVVNGARKKKGDPDFLPVLQNDVFPDVGRENPFYEYIMAAYSYFIVGGYSDGTFKPQLPVTRGAMSKMVENTRQKLWGKALTPPSDPEPDPSDPDLFTDSEVQLLIDDDAVLGNKDSAEVIVIEWSDYECPFCRKFWDETLPQLMVKYVDTGKAVWVFRDLPLDFHANDFERALAAECAGEVGGDINYFEYHDWLFLYQSTLTTSDLYDYAENIGISRSEFATCFDNEELSSEVQADKDQAGEFGISGTPTFIIVSYNSSGELVIEALPGAHPQSTFEEVIDRLLTD
ncbi:thioredoxin domain-containing protein [Candidatus Dojkabacteria bacterium]|nr:thioredoxin domain-containing protein [Candidatus Dojkabacteria bacterium]